MSRLLARLNPNGTGASSDVRQTTSCGVRGDRNPSSASADAGATQRLSSAPLGVAGVASISRRAALDEERRLGVGRYSASAALAAIGGLILVSLVLAALIAVLVTVA